MPPCEQPLVPHFGETAVVQLVAAHADGQVQIALLCAPSTQKPPFIQGQAHATAVAMEHEVPVHPLMQLQNVPRSTLFQTQSPCWHAPSLQTGFISV